MDHISIENNEQHVSNDSIFKLKKKAFSPMLRSVIKEVSAEEEEKKDKDSFVYQQ